jgi:hypothetical protein
MVYIEQSMSPSVKLRIERRINKAYRLIDNPLHDNPKRLKTIFESSEKFLGRVSAVDSLKFGVICANIYVFMKKELDRTGRIGAKSRIKKSIGKLVERSSLKYMEQRQAKWFFSKVVEQTAMFLGKRTDFDSFRGEILHYYHTNERHPKAKTGFNGLQVAIMMASLNGFFEKIRADERHFMAHDMRETIS